MNTTFRGYWIDSWDLPKMIDGPGTV